jgi:cytidylate kinase
MGKVITIDGPSGAGKSTVSKALAAKLQYLYLDTGALYRALAYQALKNNVDIHRPDELAGFCLTTQVTLENFDGKMTVYVNGENVDDKIRTEEVGLAASAISAFPVVREKLLSLQREAGALGNIVAEGRDMGTVIFPDADIKFFLDASAKERVRRRCQELTMHGYFVDYQEVERDLIRRDKQDRERKVAPLIPSENAVIIDSTTMTADDVVEKMISIIQSTGGMKT